MSRRWRISDESASAEPVIDRLLSLRGIVTEEDRKRFLEPDYDRDLHDPFLFSSMEDVMVRIRSAKVSGERVGIFGDFDADGITSSVLLREGMERIGVHVSIYIPDKHSEGHGLSIPALDFFSTERCTLVFTVDCGMMNHAEIAEANARDVDIIVIDHHHVPETLPAAFAIVNPKLRDEPYPFKELCGAGTTFKVLQAIYKTFLPGHEGELKWLLDVAAVGTVADVMPLVGENRVIVAYGLIVLSKTRRAGFQEMFALGRMPIRSGKTPVARDIAFHVAPRINAASRMAHARVAHDLLMESDVERARKFAMQLEEYNDERRKVSESVSALVRETALGSVDRKIVFAAHEHFHFGVIGLVAGRIAHEFRKPVIVLTKGETESRGSLRSIPEVNIIEALEECSDLLVRFGGHAQAAGLLVRNENLEKLESRLEGIVESRLSGMDTEPELVADMAIDPTELSLDLARAVRKLAPFGEGNPEPVFFIGNAEVSDLRPVGSDGKHLKLSLLTSGGKSFDSIGFSLADRIPDLRPGDKIDILFQIDENEWQGSVKLQLKLVDMRRVGGIR
jgi:single-stranded-DNA-specific exonuclease